MMNKLTRNPGEVQTETESCFFHHYAIENENNRKPPKLLKHERVTTVKYSGQA